MKKLQIIKNKIRNYSRWIFLGDKFIPEVKRWFKENGDSTLRLSYPLNSSSIVFDVGGYEGEWAREIYEKYQSNIFIFEPVMEYAKDIEIKFKAISKIRTFQFGLSDKDCTLDIVLNEDNSSFFIKGKGETQSVQLRAFTQELLSELGVSKIHLLKINIEGSEYPLLESIIQSGLINKITYLQIQFHNFVPNAITQRNKIRSLLSLTHRESWCYEFVWESWELKA